MLLSLIVDLQEKLAGARDLSEEQLRKAALKDKEKRQPQPAQKSEKAEGYMSHAKYLFDRVTLLLLSLPL
jgi:hypothetical protein